MTSADQLYTTTAVSDGDSHEVRVDGAEPAALKISAPAELGGPGGAWNAESLYAASLAACLHQALVLTASAAGHDLGGSTVSAEVSLSHRGAEGYDLRARLEVGLPGVPDEDDRRSIVDLAVSHCPLAGGVDVSVR